MLQAAFVTTQAPCLARVAEGCAHQAAGPLLLAALLSLVYDKGVTEVTVRRSLQTPGSAQDPQLSMLWIPMA